MLSAVRDSRPTAKYREVHDNMMTSAPTLHAQKAQLLATADCRMSILQDILGEKVYRSLRDIPSPDTIDILDVFRRAEDLEPHLPDILELKPKVHPCPISCLHQ